MDKELVKDATEEKRLEVRIRLFPFSPAITNLSLQAEDIKRTAKRKAEEERIAKLSAEQQRKAREKEKKKSMRKGTTKVRMG